ncbi:MAG: response regulator [Verrucomicrobia bacterium]|nr:response regulator [Verrucomicrobiota bacterium]
MTRRVLIVDDEKQICELYGMFFEREGFVVSRAFNAEMCMAEIAKNSPDVVLLDINLAQDDGLSLLGKIKESQPRSKVVMMTGMGFLDDLLREALNRGADGYLSKGLPSHEVIGAVRRVMP